MNIINRNLDVITEHDDLEFLGKFKDFPVFMGCTEKEISSDVLMDMDFYISKSSGVIQITPLPDLSTIYQHSHWSGTVGSLWKLHHKSFASFINSYNPKNVLEIGGGSGILSVNFKTDHNDIPWTIIDPNPTPVENCKAQFVNTFFDKNFVIDQPIDSIVHSHVFEHVFDPNKFINDISSVLSVGMKLFFSIPNLSVMLNNKFTNAINFEHTMFLAEPYVEHLLSKHGFRVVGKQYFLDDHSIFYAAIKDNQVNEYVLSPELYSQHKTTFLEFNDYYSNLINWMNTYLESCTEPVYIFGAHVFSQFLINRGLNTEKIISILDNDIKKQGNRLYGTTLYVESPSVLKKLKNPVVILKVSNYKDEIKKDILQNINANVTFLEEIS